MNWKTSVYQDCQVCCLAEMSCDITVGDGKWLKKFLCSYKQNGYTLSLYLHGNYIPRKCAGSKAT